MPALPGHLSRALTACLVLLLIGCAASPSYLARDQALPGMEPRLSQAPSARAAFGADTQAQAPPTPTANDAADQGDSPEPFRPQVVYTAELGLRVDRVAVVQEKAEQMTARHGGYVGESSPGRLLLRVPADRFELAMEELAELGEVTGRQVHAQDITDRVFDLQSRLRSAYAMRDRLIEMIQRADNIEHALKVEQELARVVEQIELIQGRLRLAKQQVAYATITLTIVPTPEQQRLRPTIPIAWVRDLGQVFHERATINVSAPRRLKDGVKTELPEGFICYYQEDYLTQAIDANGLRIRVRRFKNFEGGTQAFWSSLIARSLHENAGLELEEQTEVTIQRDKQADLIKGTRRIAGETVHYLIAVACTEDYVYAYEAWGVDEYYKPAEKGVMGSVKTMRASESWGL